MTQTNILFWGNNQHGLLSPTPSKSLSRPQCLSLPYPISDLSASEKHITFLTTDGSLFAYGLNLDGRFGTGHKPDQQCSLNNPLKVNLPGQCIKVKCGFSHTCVQLNND